MNYVAVSRTSFSVPSLGTKNWGGLCWIVRLEGPGTSPTETTVSVWTNTTTFTNSPDCTVSCTYDTISNSLIFNTAGFPTTTSLGKPFKFKGPYLDVQPDPWGRKYLVNI